MFSKFNQTIPGVQKSFPHIAWIPPAELHSHSTSKRRQAPYNNQGTTHFRRGVSRERDTPLLYFKITLWGPNCATHHAITRRTDFMKNLKRMTVFAFTFALTMVMMVTSAYSATDTTAMEQQMAINAQTWWLKIP
jgi:hypothetical protein